MLLGKKLIIVTGMLLTFCFGAQVKQKLSIECEQGNAILRFQIAPAITFRQRVVFADFARHLQEQKEC